MVAAKNGRKFSSAVMARVQTLQPASVSPNNAWYSLASQYNKALKRDSRKSAASPLAQRYICKKQKGVIMVWRPMPHSASRATEII